jgi:hypothetical protein
MESGPWKKGQRGWAKQNAVEKRKRGKGDKKEKDSHSHPWQIFSVFLKIDY